MEPRVTKVDESQYFSSRVEREQAPKQAFARGMQTCFALNLRSTVKSRKHRTVPRINSSAERQNRRGKIGE
jgi:organic hydroperoxide reductase OsmC/OhrA